MWLDRYMNTCPNHCGISASAHMCSVTGKPVVQPVPHRHVQARYEDHRYPETAED